MTKNDVQTKKKKYEENDSKTLNKKTLTKTAMKQLKTLSRIPK